MIVSEAKRYREHVASNKIVELRINRFETFFAKPAFLSSFSPRTIFSILSLPHLQAFNCRQMFQIPRFLLSLLLSSPLPPPRLILFLVRFVSRRRRWWIPRGKSGRNRRIFTAEGKRIRWERKEEKSSVEIRRNSEIGGGAESVAYTPLDS